MQVQERYDGNIQYNIEQLPNMKQESMLLSLNFSLLEDYFDGPYRFKLSMFYGFKQLIVHALGYRNVLHETIRNIHIAVIIKVNGRIDLVKKVVVGNDEQISIIDFKIVNKQAVEFINKEQLKRYALGYQELTGTTADYMEVYQLNSERSVRESITDAIIQEVCKEIIDVATNIRNNNLPRKCNKENCSKCHLNYLCLSKAEKKKFAI